MASEKTFRYMCGTCRETFDHLNDHILLSGHKGSEKLFVGSLELEASSGNFGYYFVKFDKTYDDFVSTTKMSDQYHLQRKCEQYLSNKQNLRSICALNNFLSCQTFTLF